MASTLSERPPDVKDVNIVWLTAGLGCDGDTVSVTNAEQPSIEDVILGAIPGLPRAHPHNPVLAKEVGDEFMEYFYRAERGELDPYVFVVEGSIPNETIKAEGYWAAQGTDPRTGDFADEYGSPKCLVKIGCWGPVVNCNVTKRGWMRCVGGRPNVGGICIACTMPGFLDKFMPFMDEPPGSRFSVGAVGLYGGMIRALSGITNNTVNKEPKWRHPGPRLTTGYRPRTY